MCSSDVVHCNFCNLLPYLNLVLDVTEGQGWQLVVVVNEKGQQWYKQQPGTNQNSLLRQILVVVSFVEFVCFVWQSLKTKQLSYEKRARRMAGKGCQFGHYLKKKVSYFKALKCYNQLKCKKNPIKF